MEYRKERNFIVAYENNIYQAKWDILTNQFYGKKGGIVKTVPAMFNSAAEFDYNSEYLHVMRQIYVYFRKRTRLNYSEYAENCEKLISLNIKIGDISQLRELPRMTKSFVEYLRINCNNTYYNKEQYQNWKETQKYEGKLNGKSDTWKRYFYTLIKELPVDYVIPMLNKAENEKLFSDISYYNSGLSFSIETIIKNYYKYAMALYNEVKPTPNLLTNYRQLSYAYIEYQNKNLNQILKQNNDKKFLYFENEEYKAYPIITKEEFHFEGEEQHNCVERMYMERVRDDKTYIVTIRKKSNPNHTYITCEVNHNGNIVQYLAFANNTPNEQSAYVFKKQYQEHLRHSLNLL